MVIVVVVDEDDDDNDDDDNDHTNNNGFLQNMSNLLSVCTSYKLAPILAKVKI